MFAAFIAYYLSTLYISQNPFPENTLMEIISISADMFFWSLAVAGIYFILLGSAMTEFASAMKTRLWAPILFAGYISFHLIIYGVVLEKILISLYGAPPFNSGLHAFLSYGAVFYPHTPLNTLIELSYNPSLSLYLPPFYGIALGTFSFFTAFLIAILVVVHIYRLQKSAPSFKKAGYSIIYPSVGVIGGASCCISIPELVASYAPLSSSILLIPAWDYLLTSLYFLLPIAVIVAFSLTLLHSGLHGK